MEVKDDVELTETASEQSAETSGSTIGAYEILDTIGTGGMGVVHKVRHRGSNTVLAMKILKGELTDDPVNIKRFQQELKTTSLLNHPNVVPIYDSGIAEDGRPYFVMEYLEGSTLEEILSEEGFMDVDRFVGIFAQVCDALAQAHDKRIIHRDLKPSNIMLVTTDTGFELVKVLDFGIARVFQRTPKTGSRLTQLGDVLGSPLYMSPEQCLSQKLDERSDIYSLGVVMYEALAGQLPFAAEKTVEIIMAHLKDKPKSIRSFRPDFNIPADLENLVFSCLEKDAPLRPAKIQDVADELKRISSTMKDGSLFYGLRQIPRRLKHRIRRNLRNMSALPKQVSRTSVALVALGIAVYGYAQYRAQPTVEDYAQRSTIAMINHDYDSVRQNWDSALGIAKMNRTPPDAMMKLYERAADDIVTHPYKSVNISTPYSSWETVNQWNHNEEYNERLHRYPTARQYIEKALPIAMQSGVVSDQMRLLDKLVALCKETHDRKAEEGYLRKRIEIGSNVNEFGTYRELAQIAQDQARNEEAEKLWTKVIALERNQNSRPYPSGMENLADFYHNLGKFEQEEVLRREMLSDLRMENNSNNNYNYQIREQLQQLASCLAHMHREAESKELLAEAQKLKT